MHKCFFCGKSFKCLGKHNKIHFEGPNATIQAFEKITGESVVELYQSGKSATEIANIIRDRCVGLFPLKGHVLSFLKEKNITRRKTIDAMLVYYESNPIWNKGLTKEEHESIRRYGESRTGSNNPIHHTTPEQRSYTNYVTKLKRQNRTIELEQHRKSCSDKTSQWFENKENYDLWKEKYDDAREKQKTNVRDGVRKYYEHYAALDQIAPNKLATISKPELKVKAALELLDVKFKQQWYYARRSFDFFLADYRLVIEVNGMYWHAHPTQFPDENTVHPDKNVTVKQIRENDEFKKNLIIDAGLNFFVIWENDAQVVEHIVDLLRDKLSSLSQESALSNVI